MYFIIPLSIYFMLHKHENDLKIHNGNMPYLIEMTLIASVFWYFQVPVPVFLPTTLQNAEQIVKTISELKAKVPSDPLEADLIAMAEVIAQEDEKPKCSSKNMLGAI